MTYSLTITVGGVICTVHVPHEAWRDELLARYRDFLSSEPARWQISLVEGEAADPDAASWIQHDAELTRFELLGFTGVIDMATATAHVTAAPPARPSTAIDRTASYILMQELPRHHQSLLLHGVAVVRNGWGLAHSGRSGVGKTTTARLAAGHAEVLVDENLIVSLAEATPTLLSTPFWGASTPPEMIHRVNRAAPLRAILLLEHGPDFVLQPLSPSEAVLALLTTEKVAIERVSSAAAWLRVAEELVTRVPTYRFYFRPTPEVWSFLDSELGM